jgi:hypothetical protein
MKADSAIGASALLHPMNPSEVVSCDTLIMILKTFKQ